MTERLDEEGWIQLGFRYALALTHDASRADDLFQQAWLQLQDRYGRIESRRLLFVTIRNLVIDESRRSARLKVVPLDEAELEMPSAELPELTSAELDTLLGELRDEEREALFLQAVEGYTAAEIAELTERPRNTVLSLVHRARKKLQRAWAARAEPQREGATS